MDKGLLFEAFKAGEQWGVTYSTWFTPTDQDQRDKFEEFYRKFFSESTSDLLTECHNLIKSGRKIEAVRVYKTKTGCSLSEAINALNI